MFVLDLTPPISVDLADKFRQTVILVSVKSKMILTKKMIFVSFLATRTKSTTYCSKTRKN